MPTKPPKNSVVRAATRKLQSAGKNEFRLFRKEHSPYLHVRVMLGGKRRQFSTGEIMEKAAKSKARAILADIRSRGFDEAVSLHAMKKPETIGSDPTIKELGEIYESNLRFFDKAPSPESARYYVSMLARIGKLAGATRLSELTPDAIQKAKVKYIKMAEKKGRARDAVVTTLAAMIRNAAGVFSRQSLEVFR